MSNNCMTLTYMVTFNQFYLLNHYLCSHISTNVVYPCFIFALFLRNLPIVMFSLTVYVKIVILNIFLWVFRWCFSSCLQTQKKTIYLIFILCFLNNINFWGLPIFGLLLANNAQHFSGFVRQRPPRCLLFVLLPLVKLAILFIINRAYEIEKTLITKKKNLF